jgi:uncharacterized protein YbjT (DUF2867 family)
MNTKKIVVLGGTGKTGRKVADKLAKLGHEVRIGSRSAHPSFDWNDSSNWSEVLEGMDAIYVAYQPDLAVPGALESIERLMNEIRRSSIQKVVLLSGKGEKEAELCEQVVIHSDVDYSILRCSWFNQNFSESFFLDPIRVGQVALPKAEAKVPYVDTDDIADMAVEVILNDQHRNQLYELTGPKVYSFREVIELISRETGRTIQFTEINLPSYIDMLRNHDVPEDFLWLINYLFSTVLDAPGNDAISSDISKVLGRNAKSLEQYVIETAQTEVWRHLELTK